MMGNGTQKETVCELCHKRKSRCGCGKSLASLKLHDNLQNRTEEQAKLSHKTGLEGLSDEQFKNLQNAVIDGLICADLGALKHYEAAKLIETELKRRKEKEV